MALLRFERLPIVVDETVNRSGDQGQPVAG